MPIRRVGDILVRRVGDILVRRVGDILRPLLQRLDGWIARLVWPKLLAHRPPQTADEIHVVAAEAAPPSGEERTLLSPLDVFECRFPESLTHVLPAAPPIEALRRSLARLLCLMPELGGKVVVEGRAVYVEHARPVATLVLVHGAVSRAEVESGGALPERAMASLDVGIPLKEGVPLFEARLTPIEPGGGALLSVAVQHGIVDLQSLIRVVSEWARLCRDEARGVASPAPPARIPSERTNLLRRGAAPPSTSAPSSNAASCSPPPPPPPPPPPAHFDMEALGRQGWLVNYFSAELVAIAKTTSLPSVLRRLRFEPAHIAALKARVRAGAAWAQFEAARLRLSAHDVVTAALCQLLATTHPSAAAPDGLSWTMVNILNWRERTRTVSDGYFGNATTHPCLCDETSTAPPLRAVLDADLSELALRVRALSDSTGEAEVQQLLEFMSHVQYEQPGGLDGLLRVAAPLLRGGLGLWVSSSCKYDAYDADFGTGRPTQPAFFDIPPIPHIAIYFRAHDEPKAVVANVRVLAESADAFDRAFGALTRALEAEC